MNPHLFEVVAKQRMEEEWARAAERRLVRSLAPPSPGLRVQLGVALIRLGRSLAGRAPRPARERRRAIA